MQKSNLATKVNSILELAWENKLWTISTLLVSVALSFVTSFILALPATVAAQEQDRIRFERFKEESGKVTMIYDILDESMKAYIGAIKHYSEYFGQKPIKELPSSQALVEGAQKANNAKRLINIVRGSLLGIRFQNQELESFREQFKDSLEQLNGLLDLQERFYFIVARNDVNEMKRMRPQWDNMDSIHERTGAQLLVAVEDFSVKARAITAEQTVEISRAVGGLKIFAVQSFLALLSIIYIFVYGALALFFVVKQYTKKESRIILIGEND